MSLLKGIQKLRPNAEVTIIDNDYSTAIWHKLEGEIPTQAEVDVAIEAIKQEEIQAEAEAEAKRSTALAKLEALGLTVDDLEALGL